MTAFEKSMEPSKSLKPMLRGYLHQEAFFFFAGASVLLIASAENRAELLACVLYSFSLLFLFAVSACYHRPTWNPSQRQLWRRLDHAAIFVLIAGTTSPIALLALPEKRGHELLIISWVAASIGVAVSLFLPKTPKWVTAILAILVGWLCLPFIHELAETLNSNQIYAIFAGGVLYTVGALVYALKRPILSSKFFGYHELFHLLTILAAGLHFAVIYTLIS